MYVERRPVASIVFFALAPLAKETAIVTPLALLAWELLCPLLRGKAQPGEALCLLRAATAIRILVSVVPGSAGAVVSLPSSPDRLLLRQSGVPALQPASDAQPLAHCSRDPDTALAHAGLPEPVRPDPGRRLRHEPASAAGVRWHSAPPYSHQRAAGVWSGHRGERPGSVGAGRRSAGSLHASGAAASDPDLCFHAVAAPPALGRGGSRLPAQPSSSRCSLRHRIGSLRKTRCCIAITSSSTNWRPMNWRRASRMHACSPRGRLPMNLRVRFWDTSDSRSQWCPSRTSRRSKLNGPRKPPISSMSRCCFRPSGSLRTLCFGACPSARKLQERFFDYREELAPQQVANILGGRTVRYLNRNNEWVAIRRD